MMEDIIKQFQELWDQDEEERSIAEGEEFFSKTA